MTASDRSDAEVLRDAIHNVLEIAQADLRLANAGTVAVAETRLSLAHLKVGGSATLFTSPTSVPKALAAEGAESECSQGEKDAIWSFSALPRP